MPSRLPETSERPQRRRRAAARVRTIGDELAWAGRKLGRGGAPHSRKDALAVWAVLAGENPGTVWLNRLNAAPGEAFVRRYRTAVGRLVSGVPFQAAVGLASFRLLDLAVNPHVLIPRVETEELVERVLAWFRERRSGLRWGLAADVGTGSGAIALSLALEGAFERVIATDVSPEALDVARRNIETTRPGTPVDLRMGSWLEPLAGLAFDVIVSNPPYLTTAESDDLLPEVRDYEPRLAFDGGEDGLDAYRSILAGAGARLRDGGLLAFEIDSRRPEATLSLAFSHGWSDARVMNDVFGRPRYLLAVKPEGTT